MNKTIYKKTGIEGILTRRVIATCVATLFLFGAMTLVVRFSLSAQQQGHEAAAITYEQRLLLSFTSERLLFLLKYRGSKLPVRVLKEAQADIREAITSLNNNQRTLESLYDLDAKRGRFSLQSMFVNQEQTDLVREMAKSFISLNERFSQFTNADLATLETGFDLWKPQDLSIVRFGKNTALITNLNKKIYATVSDQNETLQRIHNFIPIVLIFLLWLIWSYILKPMLDQIHKQLEQIDADRDELSNIAFYDALTGFLNRASFNKFLDDNTPTSLESKFAAIVIDVDQFKSINDSLGHSVGDEVLKEITSRMRRNILPNEAQYRTGGDEFVIMFSGVESSSEVSRRAQEIVDTCKEPVIINNQRLRPTISLGLAVQDKHTQDIRVLVNAGDISLYHAKGEGGGQYVNFNETPENSEANLLQFQHDLANALNTSGIVVYYQPIINTLNGKTIAFEALARWNHPELGILSPDRWLPTATRLGMLSQLYYLVLRSVCDDLRTLREEGYSPTPIHINISRELLLSEQMLNGLLEANSQLSPEGFNLIEIEVPESIVLDQKSRLVNKQLQKLIYEGIRIHLDDFGTGHAALTHLLTLPYDSLKIDKSFIQGITEHEQKQVIVNGILDIARGLRKTVICEGVENHQTKELLEKMGCTQMQGFLYSTALPINEVKQFLTHQPE